MNEPQHFLILRLPLVPYAASHQPPDKESVLVKGPVATSAACLEAEAAAASVEWAEVLRTASAHDADKASVHARICMLCGAHHWHHDYRFTLVEWPEVLRPVSAHENSKVFC